jgi:hypothetical protein
MYTFRDEFRLCVFNILQMLLTVIMKEISQCIFNCKFVNFNFVKYLNLCLYPNFQSVVPKYRFCLFSVNLADSTQKNPVTFKDNQYLFFLPAT